MAAGESVSIEHASWRFSAEKHGIIDEELAEQWKSQLKEGFVAPLLPEMLFDRTTVALSCAGRDVGVFFSVFQGLREWLRDPLPSLKVSASKNWEKYHSEYGTGTDIDWTFSTKYGGCFRRLSDGAPLPQIEGFAGGVDFELLQRRDPILLFVEALLFEDEQADNGVSKLTVKMRVMAACFFVLVRFWCRVDNVLFRVFDTRVFHKFGTDAIVRDFQWHEDTYEDLRKAGRLPSDPSQFNDEAVMLPRLSKREHTVIGYQIPSMAE